jgi:ubiquinol-cytochrome c reductase iron-sulfur subunit
MVHIGADIAQPTQSARRDFITQMAGAFVAVGSTAALWPFIDQMNPNPGTPPPEVTDVDLAPIAPGQMISVRWRGLLVFVRHRTRQEIEQARGTPLSDLRDRFARNDALPAKALATDGNRIKAGHDNWLVVVGVCTHLGCMLKSSAAAGADDPGEGWFCPCHAARFDVSGRVRSGPALMNLPVPPYQFVTASKISIG